MKTNYEKTIRDLLESDVTSYKISKETGISQQLLVNYRREENPTPIENISLGRAQALVDFALNQPVYLEVNGKQERIVGVSNSSYEGETKYIAKIVDIESEGYANIQIDWVTYRQYIMENTENEEFPLPFPAQANTHFEFGKNIQLSVKFGDFDLLIPTMDLTYNSKFGFHTYAIDLYGDRYIIVPDTRQADELLILVQLSYKITKGELAEVEARDLVKEYLGTEMFAEASEEDLEELLDYLD